MVTYAERPWTKFYDPNVPPSLEPYPEITLHDFLRQSAAKAPNSPALIASARIPVFGRRSKTMTYGELDRLTDALACALIEMGLKKGDRVAVVLPNVMAFPVAFYGILKAGGVVAATNPTYPAKKMEYQINDCDAEIVIVLSMFYTMIKEIQPNTKVKHVIASNVKEQLPQPARKLFELAKEKKDGHYIAQLGEGDFWLPDLLKKHLGDKPKVNVEPDEVALFQYTGGTTGVSKGAMLTHRSLVINTIQMQSSWTRSSDPRFSADPSSHLFLGAIPMFHVAGLIAVMGQAIAAGAPIVLVPNARDLDDVIDVIHTFKPHAFVGVPALYNGINNHPRVKSGEVSLSSLLLSTSGTAPLPPAVQRDYTRLNGRPIVEGYGMSECIVTHANPPTRDPRAGSVGIPYPDLDSKIVSLEDGVTEVPVGEIGEIIVAGPTLMKGYHHMPTETANTLREVDGRIWIYTGDIGRMDEDGYFYIVDRKKDMAIIGGFNVYPTTIENALREHPAVLDVGVAAIAHPDRPGQEALKAWVVLRPGMTATQEELVKHCETLLAPYEVPRRFAFVAEIPKTAVGKTLRRELVQQEMAAMEA